MLPPRHPYKTKQCKGLMHKKIVVIDKRLIFLGTANLTTTSLRHHANVMGLGLRSPRRLPHRAGLLPFLL